MLIDTNELITTLMHINACIIANLVVTMNIHDSNSSFPLVLDISNNVNVSIVNNFNLAYVQPAFKKMYMLALIFVLFLYNFNSYIFP